MAALCVRLGFWQLERLEQKRAANRVLGAALAGPVLDLEGGAPPGAVAPGRYRVRGVYDETRQILLRGRAHDGAPGVEVLTPLRLLRSGGGAILVRRGWLPSSDAVHAAPWECAEPGTLQVVGVMETPGPSSESPLRLTAPGGRLLLSTRGLPWDSLARRFPYPLWPQTLRQLPDSSLPARPLRLRPASANEAMHLSYAVQWFSFAGILVIGVAVLGARGRGRPPAA